MGFYIYILLSLAMIACDSGLFGRFLVTLMMMVVEIIMKWLAFRKVLNYPCTNLFRSGVESCDGSRMHEEHVLSINRNLNSRFSLGWLVYFLKLVSSLSG